MASHNLPPSFFFSLVTFLLLILSPQTQAREGKFFNFFSHFTTTSHKPKSHHPHSPSPSPSESIAATPESSILAAPAPAPGSAAPAPSPADSEFLDRGDGYGLYGTTSLNNNNNYDSNNNHESFMTGFGNKLYSSSSSNNYEDEELYNNNNDRYSYNNNGYNGGYERKREGMSDTRFVENGEHFYDVNQNDHYKVEGYEPIGRGSGTYTENSNYGGSYYDKNNNNNYRKYPNNEFETMEEYEKQQENQGYVP